MILPEKVSDAISYLNREIQLLSLKLEGKIRIPWAKQYAAPSVVKEGMIVWADGTTWNPGSGEGLYHYRGGVWRHLG